MLEVEKASVVFHPPGMPAFHALQGVSVGIPAEQFAVVIGTNGSGKTTLLNAVAGVCALDEGKICLDGHDMTRLPEHRRARWIGRVFQDPLKGTAPEMTVAENLALGARRGHFPGLGRACSARALREIRDRVAVLRMGLEDRLDTLMGSLSGGQRQALTLLMASWNRPKLLLLDEHTAALDPRTAEQVIQLTRQIIAQERLTVLMVTHAMQQAVSMGDRLLMLHHGRIVLDVSGAEKARLSAEDLFARFEDLRRRDLLTPAALEVLRARYV